MTSAHFSRITCNSGPEKGFNRSFLPAAQDQTEYFGNTFLVISVQLCAFLWLKIAFSGKFKKAAKSRDLFYHLIS